MEAVFLPDPFTLPKIQVKRFAMYYKNILILSFERKNATFTRIRKHTVSQIEIIILNELDSL